MSNPSLGGLHLILLSRDNKDNRDDKNYLCRSSLSFFFALAFQHLSHHFCTTAILPTAVDSAFIGYLAQMCPFIFFHTTCNECVALTRCKATCIYILLTSTGLLSAMQCYLCLCIHHNRASKFLNLIMPFCCVPVQCQIQICIPGTNISLELFSFCPSFLFGPAKLAK